MSERISKDKSTASFDSEEDLPLAKRRTTTTTDDGEKKENEFQRKLQRSSSSNYFIEEADRLATMEKPGSHHLS